MKYFLDTEFIEDGRTIDLISIGIVAEDGREYYAINSEFNSSKASDWVKENVLAKLPPKNPIFHNTSPRLYEESKAWKELRFIKWELLEFFVEPDYGNCTNMTADFLQEYKFEDLSNKPELWGYYSAYDFVVLSQTLSSVKNPTSIWQKLLMFLGLAKIHSSHNPMVDNYPGFLPYYCRDIKQECDRLGNPELPKQTEGEHNALADARWNKQAWEFLNEYACSQLQPQ